MKHLKTYKLFESVDSDLEDIKDIMNDISDYEDIGIYFEEDQEKIKINSKKQGLDRTIEYVKNNKDKIYNILIEIGRRNKRSTIVLQYNITTDLYNKIKRKYSLYVALINIHTEYKIHPVNIKKIAGMRIKAYNDYKSTLIKMYKLIDKNIKRKDVVSQLGITFSFYDRFKNQKLLFLDFINSNDIEIKE